GGPVGLSGKTHVSQRRHALLGRLSVMPRHEVDPGDYVGPRASTLAVEYAHTEQAHVLSDAKVSTTDDPGHVRAVPVAVDGVTFTVNCVVEADGPLAKFVVRDENAGIDNIGI